nr:4'-phosphopantetheinyl transferase superfamily protein [Priestia megaterium]
MGIDIERISIERKAILRSQMTEREKDIIKSFPYSEEVMLTLLWTAKESLSKILKTGLTIPLEILEVNMLEIKGNTVLGYFNNLFQYCVSSWVFDEYVCSIAYPKNTLLSLEIAQDVLNKIEQAMNNKVFINK